MEKTGLICIAVVQGNSYKSFKQSTTYIISYSVSIFSISVLVHSLWSVNPVNQNILVEYFLRIHFSLEVKSCMSGFRSLSLQKGQLSWIILIKKFNANKNFILFC